MELGQADRAMPVVPVTVAVMVGRAILAIRQGAGRAARRIMVDGPGELNRRVRSRFDDVEDEMDRQNDLDKKRSKAAPRTKSRFLHPFEHQPKRCMEIPPPLKLMELNLLRKPIRQKTRPRKDDRMTRRERRHSKTPAIVHHRKKIHDANA
jgi:hypothetical protein